MTKNELQNWTKMFSLSIIKLVEKLPKNTTGWAIGKQIVRSAMSVGANYRSACRSRSKSEFSANEKDAW